MITLSDREASSLARGPKTTMTPPQARTRGMFGLYPGQVAWAFELPVTCLLRLAKLPGQAYSDFIALFG